MNAQTESKSILNNATVLERALIYCRVSTDEQAESGTSIDNQVSKGLAYAEAVGIKVIEVFKEDYTGTTLDRPELTKVRAMLKSGLADNLVVYNNTRLDRSKFGRDTLVLFSEWYDLGVSVHFSETRQRVNLNDPLQVLLYGSFGGWNAGNDRDATVKKLRDGRVSRAEQGYVVPAGNTPFGYRAVKKDGKRWQYEIYEPEAEIVRLIYHWYIFGDEGGEPLAMGAIAEKLSQMGIETQGDKKKSSKQRAKGEWARSTIINILKNQTYYGQWYYSGVAVTVPAIINRETWEAAQRRIEYNKAMSTRNKKGKYLFSGRCTCPYCGHKMTAKTIAASTPLKYYACPAGNERKKIQTVRQCNNVNYRADIADRVAWEWIEEIISDEEKLKAGLLAYQAQQEDIVKPVKDEIAIIAGLIAKHESELNELLATMKLLTSPRAKANVALDIERVEGTLDELEKRREALQGKLETKSLTDEQVMSLIQFAKMIAADLDMIRNNFEAKRKVLEWLDVQVTFFADDVEEKQLKRRKIAGRKVRVTIKLCALDKTLSVENLASSSPVLNREYWLISQVLELN